MFFNKVLEPGNIPKRRSSVFGLNLELFSVLNHCNTSSVKDFVNWHSGKVWSIEPRSPQYMQLLSDLILNLKSSFLVSTIL